MITETYMIPAIIRSIIEKYPKLKNEEVKQLYMDDMLKRLRENARKLSVEKLQNILDYLDELSSYLRTTIDDLSKLLIEEGSSDEKKSFMEHILKDMKYSIGDEVESLAFALEVITLATEVLKNLAPIENGTGEQGKPKLALKMVLN